MNPIYKVIANTTVNTIVVDAYDVLDPQTGTTDVSKRDGAAQALRDLNAGLPSDETTITAAGTPFIRLRYVPRIPWRVPPASSTLRDALAAINIRNVDDLATVSVAWLMDNLSGSPNQVDVERIRNIARLMRVSGLDRDTAAYFHDDATTPIETPVDLGGATQSAIKGLIDAHVTAGFPAALQSDKPWIMWKQHARLMTRRNTVRRLNMAPTPLQAGTVEIEAAYWRQLESSDRRTSAERTSAKSIRLLYEVQADLLRANRALARRDFQSAYAGYLSAYGRMGRQALADTLIQTGSVEVSGPSVETILTVCGTLLDRIEELDVETATTRLAVRPLPVGNGIRSFRIPDLLSNSAAAVRSALDQHKVHVTGAVATRALSKALSERTKSSLGQGMRLRVTTPNDARSVDLGLEDAEQLRQNQRMVNIGTLRSTDASVWTAVESELRLRDVRTAAVNSLAGTAKDNLLNNVSAQYPDSLTTNMTAFDRFMAYTPSRAPQSSPLYVPLTSSFSVRYREDVLTPLLEAADTTLWTFTKADFADPVRFAFILPQLFARHVPQALGRCLRGAGRSREARGVESAARKSTANPSNAMTVALVDSVSTGVAESAAAVDCGDYSYDPEGMYNELRALNEEGDYAYQTGQYATAAARYSTVIARVRVCTDLAAAKLVNNIAAVRDALRPRIVSGDPSLSVSSIIEYGVPNGVDTLEPIFGDVVASTSTWLATSATLVKTSKYSWVSNAAASSYHYYVAPTKSGVELDGESGQTLDPPDGEFTDGVWIRDLLPPPATNGGVSPPNCGGGAGATSTTPFNYDLILQEALHAVTFLEQLNLGLNWLGFDPQTTPPWQYSYLRDQARYYASKADDLQQRTLSLLSQAEDAKLTELAKQLNTEIAGQAAIVAQAQYEVASKQVTAARASKTAADHQLEDAKEDRAWEAVGVAVGAVTAVVGAASAGPVGAITGLVKASISIRGQIDAMQDRMKGAADNVAIAAAQLDVAAAQQGLASEQVALAQLQANAAIAEYTALMDQDTDSTNLFLLTDAAEKLARSYLRMANRFAWLAERAYQFESRRSTGFIHMTYASTDVFVTRFSGAATLLGDLDNLEHARVTGTTERYQLIKTTISLRELDPSNLVLLQAKGACLLRLTQRQLDERFPGLYLHSLRRVEVELDGLLPANGVTGILRTATNSFVRVPNSAGYVDSYDAMEFDWVYPPDAPDSYEMGSDPATAPPFVMKPLFGTGFTQVISEYRRTQDSVVLAPPEGALDAFEHLGVDVLWGLQIPRAGNGIDLANIADVRFVLYFTAVYDEDLAAAQDAKLAADRLSRAVALHATSDAADTFAAFTAAPSDTSFLDVRLLRFTVTEDMLPRNLKQSVIEDFSIALVQQGAKSVGLRFRATAMPDPAAATVPYGTTAPDIDGQVYSAVSDVSVSGDGYSHTARTGDFPALDALVAAVDDPADTANYDNVLGDWVIKVLPDDNASLCLKDDSGADVTISGGQVDLSGSGSMIYTGGDWANAAATVRVKVPSSGAVSIWLRDDELGAGVRASLDATAGVTLGDGNTTTTAVQAIEAGVWTEAILRVYGSTAVIELDGVEVARIDTLHSSVPSSGTLSVRTASGASGNVADVRVTKLRYDGTELEDLVSDTFEADAAGWALSSADWADAPHKVLDLSFLEDVLLIISYTAVVDFPE